MYYDTKKLVIGYYVDDGYVTSVPAMRRGVMEAIEKLKEHGHTVSNTKIYQNGLQHFLHVRPVNHC